jgi:hypothetical protein
MRPDESGEAPPRMPRELTEQAVFIRNASNSGIYRHFLERFLLACGRVLRVPWWTVHTSLYLATTASFLYFMNVARLYPHGELTSFLGEQIGECIFTTFMLFHIRASRTVALSSASQITDAHVSMFWLQRYLAPACWGWMIRRGRSVWVVRNWEVIALLLVGYYVPQFLFYRSPWLSLAHTKTYWDIVYPYPQLLYIYPTVAKASMMVAALGHFWWLSGLSKIVRGTYPTRMSSIQSRSLYLDCGGSVVRFTAFLCAATLAWATARALSYGFTFWAYLYSAWLTVLVVTQIKMLARVRIFPSTAARSIATLFIPDCVVSWEFTGIRRFAPALAVWGFLSLAWDRRFK